MRRALAIVVFTLASVAILLYSLRPGAQFDWKEGIGFITGLWCVWLTILKNVWNFPIGIANSFFLGIVFLGGRLFADAGLQLMFIALGFQGWWLWLHGGARRTELPVGVANRIDFWQSAALTLIALPLFTWRLTLIKDAAPFWDAAITVFSVVAQVLLNRKRIENWWVWLGVDLVSVWLYAVKHFYLTAVLYAIYCAMAVWGYTAWRKDLALKEPRLA